MNRYIFLILTLCVAQSLSIKAKDAKVTSQVSLTISVDGKELDEKIVLGLFGNDVPKSYNLNLDVLNLTE